MSKFLASSLLGVTVLLSGCALQTTATDATSSQVSLSGRSMGGSIPIVGATITLYAAGTTGYGSSPSIIGLSSAVTDAGGNFTLTRTASCTDPQQLYIVSTGGTQAGVSNSKIVTMEALGTCSTVTSGIYVIINEATTVAAAYALSGFANVDGSSTAIGTSSTNISGLVHAFANATNLVNYVGQAQTTTKSGNGAIPNTLINTLASALVACVDSNGTTSACTNIAVAPPPGLTTSTPTNAWQIALNWALYPRYNVTNIYNNQTAPYFFGPRLTAAPNDISVAITYSAGFAANGITPAITPVDVQADGSGNLWLSGMTGAPLAELAADGTVLSPAGGFGNSALQAATAANVALDSTSSTVWVADTGGNVFSYTPGTSVTTQYALPTNVTRNGNTPATVSTRAQGVALNSSGNVWFATGGTSGGNFNYTGELVNSAGTFTVQTSYTGNPFASGNTLGADQLMIYTGAGAFTTNAIITDNLSSTAGEYLASPYTGNTTQTANTASHGNSQGGTFDSSGNLWMLGTGNNGSGGGLCKFTAYNTTTCHTSGKVGGQEILSTPTTVATDGIGRFFVASETNDGSIVEYDVTAGFLTNGGLGFSPVDATGTAVLAGTLNNLTIDETGSIWVANGSATLKPVVQILGAAAPAVAPLSLGKYGVQP